MKGIVFDIKHFAVHDGPGVRTTVFLKGCPLTCNWCHNPESWKEEVEVVKETKMFDGEVIHTNRSIGREYTIDKIVEDVMKDELLMRESGGGVTLSGGEPFVQEDFTLNLLKEFKQLGLHTTVDTSGYVSQEVLEKSISNTDLYLYDLKTLNDDLHEKLTGVSNKKILQNFELLAQKSAKIWVRIPLIPGLNDDTKSITRMVEYLKSKNGAIQRVNVLPFHRTGFHKFDSLGIENPLSGSKEMDTSEINDVKAIFTDAGFDVKIGG